jgi:hypothetical protein
MIKILATAIVMALFLGLSSSASIRPTPPTWDCEYSILKNGSGYNIEALCIFSKDLTSKRVLLKNVEKCARAPKFMKDSKSCRMAQDKVTILCNKDSEIAAKKVVHFKSREAQLVCHAALLKL